jgi:hypothetical protein
MNDSSQCRSCGARIRWVKMAATGFGTPRVSYRNPIDRFS